MSDQDKAMPGEVEVIEDAFDEYDKRHNPLVFVLNAIRRLVRL